MAEWPSDSNSIFQTFARTVTICTRVDEPLWTIAYPLDGGQGQGTRIAWQYGKLYRVTEQDPCAAEMHWNSTPVSLAYRAVHTFAMYRNLQAWSRRPSDLPRVQRPLQRSISAYGSCATAGAQSPWQRQWSVGKTEATGLPFDEGEDVSATDLSYFLIGKFMKGPEILKWRQRRSWQGQARSLFVSNDKLPGAAVSKSESLPTTQTTAKETADDGTGVACESKQVDDRPRQVSSGLYVDTPAYTSAVAIQASSSLPASPPTENDIQQQITEMLPLVLARNPVQQGDYQPTHTSVVNTCSGSCRT